MKFLNCQKCHSIIQLPAFREEGELTYCPCKSSKGRYMSDDLHVEYWGPARILGVSNTDYVSTVRREPTLDEYGFAELRFDMFVIPNYDRCHILKREE